MRFVVAWDGSELSTLALRATLHVLSRPGDQLLVYHVQNPGRYGACEEFQLENLRQRLATELQAAPPGLRVLAQQRGGDLEEVRADADSTLSTLMTVHEKEEAEAVKISRRIIDFSSFAGADVLVMGSTGIKDTSSKTFLKTTLGSSAHLAALEAPCTVVLIRSGCRVDAKLATVFMVAVDGSPHAMHALQLCSEWARSDRDEVVCRVFGPPEFTADVERQCTLFLQESMKHRKVEYAVVPTELDESADVHGGDLADCAKQCRFRHQAFLVFGARGRTADGDSGACSSPLLSSSRRLRDQGTSSSHGLQATTLGHVSRWCIEEAPCSLIIARPKPPQWSIPTLRAESVP